MGDIALRGHGRTMYAKGGRTHVTKEGKVARKGLWYNIHQKENVVKRCVVKETKAHLQKKQLKEVN